jgi:hypothetical protein
MILDKVQRKLQDEAKKRAQARFAGTDTFTVYLREPSFE